MPSEARSLLSPVVCAQQGSRRPRGRWVPVGCFLGEDLARVRHAGCLRQVSGAWPPGPWAGRRGRQWRTAHRSAHTCRSSPGEQPGKLTEWHHWNKSTGNPSVLRPESLCWDYSRKSGSSRARSSSSEILRVTGSGPRAPAAPVTNTAE